VAAQWYASEGDAPIIAVAILPSSSRAESGQLPPASDVVVVAAPYRPQESQPSIVTLGGSASSRWWRDETNASDRHQPRDRVFESLDPSAEFALELALPSHMLA
jgi:hypothetical protein